MPDRHGLFGNDAVGPFDQGNENGRITELRIPIRKIIFRDPRAREQAPQAKTGLPLATIFSRNSLSGGQPMGSTASEVALRIK